MGLLQSDGVRVFECPSCKQTINTSMTQCPYCSAVVDPRTAEAAAELTSRVSRACNDASYVRILAGSLVGFFFLALVPFMGLVGFAGYYVLLLLVPILAIRWWLRYSSLQSDDHDYSRAKRNVGIALAIWVAFLLFTSIRIGMGLTHATAGSTS
jgi:hypothetical protein